MPRAHLKLLLVVLDLVITVQVINRLPGILCLVIVTCCRNSRLASLINELPSPAPTFPFDEVFCLPLLCPLVKDPLHLVNLPSVTALVRHSDLLKRLSGLSE